MRYLLALIFVFATFSLSPQEASAFCSPAAWKRANQLGFLSRAQLRIGNKSYSRFQRNYNAFIEKANYSGLTAADDLITTRRAFELALVYARQAHQAWSRLLFRCRGRNRHSIRTVLSQLETLLNKIRKGLKTIRKKLVMISHKSISSRGLVVLRKIKRSGYLEINRRRHGYPLMLQTAINRKAYRVMGALCSWGADVNAKISDSSGKVLGYRLLHLVVLRSDVRAFDILKRYRVQLNHVVSYRGIRPSITDIALDAFWKAYQKRKSRYVQKDAARLYKKLEEKGPGRLHYKDKFAKKIRNIIMRKFGLKIRLRSSTNALLAIPHLQKNSPRYSIHFDEIDDVGKCYINGRIVAVAKFGRDHSKWIDVTSYLTRDKNKIRFQLIDHNNGACFSYRFRIRRNQKVIWERRGSCCKRYCRVSSRIAFEETVTLR